MLNIGEKLRAARLRQNLSLRELAEMAEVSASLLSQIENEKANPSVRSLYSIAAALSLPVDYFFPGTSVDGGETGSEVSAVSDKTAGVSQPMPAAELTTGPELRFEDEPRKSRSPVVRANARSTIELMGGVTWARLTPGSEEDAEFLQICYEVGASSGAKMSRHSGREFGLILEGELLLELGFERYLLKAGDSIIFDSTTPHRLTNAGQASMQAIWVILNRQ
jgi:transcriptional regulator with XRE-family HTH domain